MVHTYKPFSVDLHARVFLRKLIDEDRYVHLTITIGAGIKKNKNLMLLEDSHNVELSYIL